MNSHVFRSFGTCRNTHHVTVAGRHGFLIKQMNTEQPGAGQMNAQNAWQTMVSDVNDPEQPRHRRHQPPGRDRRGGASSVNTFTKNGGSGIRARRIGSAP